METKQETNSAKDSYILAIIVGIALIIFFYTSTFIDYYWRLVCIWDVILAFVGGVIGKDRNIGFGGAFFISLFLSPLIGFILAFNSPRKKDIEYKEKILEVAENNATSVSIADQLHKLNELRKDGVLTDEEFATQKEKLLNK